MHAPLQVLDGTALLFLRIVYAFDGLLTVRASAVKELVTDANFDCSEEGIVSLTSSSDMLSKTLIPFVRQKLQAMDNSHVALVSLHLQAVGFEEYRCDRNMFVLLPCQSKGMSDGLSLRSLGMSLASLQKIIKSAAADDEVTLRADESQDVLGLLFESKRLSNLLQTSSADILT